MLIYVLWYNIKRYILVIISGRKWGGVGLKYSPRETVKVKIFYGEFHIYVKQKSIILGAAYA